MKILMICTVPLYGNGIATCVINYAAALSKQGCSTHILAPEGVPERVCQALEKVNITIYQLPNRKVGVRGYFQALLQTLRTGKYDVVHVHGNSCTITVELLAAMLAGCPVRIAHSHNTNCDHKKAHKLLRPLFELCVNGRLACGQEAGKWLFHSKPFTVLRNGIHLEKYAYDHGVRQQMRRKLGVDEHTLVLGHVGAFVQAKNHDFLIDVLDALKSSGQADCRLLLIGDGVRMEEICERAGEQVIFTGSVEDTSPYLQAIDVFLLPSLYEGLPFVLIEAQAAGLHCLVSDHVSREADMTGNMIFLPIQQAAPWLDALQLKGTPDRQAVSEAACRALQQAGYDMQSSADILLRYYTDLLKNRS